MKKMDVLCIGHAAYDVTLSVARHPKPDEKMQAEAIQLGGGGPAANAAVAVARLGGAACFCGYLGNDPFGEAHLHEFEAEGVETDLIIRGDHPSPVSMIFAKPDGTRTVINHKSDTPWIAADGMDYQNIRPGAVLFDGHEPLISIEIAHWARDEGIPMVLDAGSAHKGTQELAPLVDYLVASCKFALDYANTTNPQDALEKLAGVAPNVMITLGAQGLMWLRAGQSGELPAFEIEAVDSTGAGDAFHGAFALGVARKMPWPELLRFASACAALCCTTLGARAGLATTRDVNAFVGSQ